MTVTVIRTTTTINSSQSQQISIITKWRTYHKSRSYSDDDCYHERNSSRNSSTENGSTNYETFITDNPVTGCDKYSCKSKIETKSTEVDDELNTPPGIGFSFAMCHLSLSQDTDDFQLLVDSESSKYFIDPELIRGVESRRLETTRI